MAVKLIKLKYVDNSFMYVFDKPSVDETKLFWQCDKRNDNCKMRLHKNVQTGQVYSRWNNVYIL